MCSLEVYITFFGGQKGGSLEPPRTPPAYGPVPALLSMVSVAEVDVEGQNSHIWQEIILAVTHTPYMNAVFTKQSTTLFSNRNGFSVARFPSTTPITEY